MHEELWRTFDELYAVFPERGVDWNATYSQFTPLVNNGLSDDSLFNVLTAMLEPLDDAHVQLVRPGQRVWSSNRVYRELVDNDLFRLDVVSQNYLTDIRTTGEEESLTTYGRIAGQPIGYIHFPTISDTWAELDSACYPTWAASEGLIIDLRHNQGGDFTWALNELDQLNGAARPIFRSRTKNGSGADDYTPWTTWQLDGGPVSAQGPWIVFITDRYTVSAAERLVMMLRSMDNTVHLGDTTNGVLSTVILARIAERLVLPRFHPAGGTNRKVRDGKESVCRRSKWAPATPVANWMPVWTPSCKLPLMRSNAAAWNMSGALSLLCAPVPRWCAFTSTTL